jgi:hypothetical protein
MPSQSPAADTTLVVRNVQSLAHHQNQHKREPSGNSHLPPAMRRISVPAGKRDCSHGGSSVPCTIQGQISTPLSSLNNSGVADITQPVTGTPSAAQRVSIMTPTVTPGTISRNTPAPSGTRQTNSTGHVASSPKSGIA